VITKIEIQNLIKVFLIKNEDLKDLNSSLGIKQLSRNYFICRKDTKVFEIILDKDNQNNILLYYKGQIFVIKTSTILFENNSKLEKETVKNIFVKSPMPELISKILVNAGDRVSKGMGLLKIEAMKMENEIKSPVDGIVEHIKVNTGVVVEKNAVLVILKV
jgi:biotin carboxyl carrier protein